VRLNINIFLLSSTPRKRKMSHFYGNIVGKCPALRKTEALLTTQAVMDKLMEVPHGAVLERAECTCSRLGSELSAWIFHTLGHFGVHMTALEGRTMLSDHLEMEARDGTNHLLTWIQPGLTTTDGKTAGEAVTTFLTPGNLPPPAVLFGLLAVLQQKRIAILTKKGWTFLTQERDITKMDILIAWQGGRQLTLLRWTEDSGMNLSGASSMNYFQLPVTEVSQFQFTEDFKPEMQPGLQPEEQNTVVIELSDDEPITIKQEAPPDEVEPEPAAPVAETTTTPSVTPAAAPVTTTATPTQNPLQPAIITPGEDSTLLMYQRRCSELQLDNSALAAVVKEQKQKIVELSNQVAHLEESAAIQRTDVAAMEATLVSRAAEIAELEGKKKDLQTERAELLATQEKLEGRISVQSSSLKELQRANENMAVKVQGAEDRQQRAMEKAKVIEDRIESSMHGLCDALLGVQHVLDPTVPPELPPDMKLVMTARKNVPETDPANSPDDMTATQPDEETGSGPTPENQPPSDDEENEDASEKSRLGKYRKRLAMKPLRKRKSTAETESDAAQEPPKKKKPSKIPVRTPTATDKSGSETEQDTPVTSRRPATRASKGSKLPTPVGKPDVGQPQTPEKDDTSTGGTARARFQGLRTGATPSKIPRKGMRQFLKPLNSPPGFTPDDTVIQELQLKCHNLYSKRCAEALRIMKKYDVRIAGVEAWTPLVWCPVCQVNVESFRKLYIHIDLEHPAHPRPFQCSLCKSNFSRQHDLAKHQERHGERAFSCSVCFARFHLAEGLDDHMGVHTMEHRCDRKNCGKFFSNHRALTKHKISHNVSRTKGKKGDK
jgi:hypothetical protein